MTGKLVSYGAEHFDLNIYDATKHSPFLANHHVNPQQILSDMNSIVEALDDLAEATPDWDFFDENIRKDCLSNLAEKGHKLFLGIAGDKAEQLKTILKSHTNLMCQSLYPIPWELMYVSEDFSDPKLESFVGANLVVGRKGPPLSSYEFTSPNSMNRVSNGEFTQYVNEFVHDIGFAEDATLESARNRSEVGVFDKLNIRLNCLPVLNKGQTSSMLQLDDFFNASEVLVHFNSHSSQINDDEAELYVSNRFSIDSQLISTFPVCDGSIVVLNCCNGLSLKPTVKSTLASYFMEKGASAVIATIGNVGDAYATRWAKYFYEALNRGEDIVESLLFTRKQLLKDRYPNPTAFLYRYQGIESSRLSLKAAS